MKSVILIIALVTNTFGYHDPDLNYHLGQLQKLQPCDHNGNGYSYPVPAIQLTTSGIKYAQQPLVQYQTSVPSVNYAQPTYQIQNEAHGYKTTSGLSGSRTVTPQATYAQAPILSKITAAPLIAKYSISPSKASFVTQNLVSQQTSSARSSLNSYSQQSGGPVVSQVYAAPTVRYATNPALQRNQYNQAANIQSQYNQVAAQSQYNQVAAQTQYNQFTQAQYAKAQQPIQTPSVYRSPVLALFSSSAPTLEQYSTNSQYSAPAAQYSTVPQLKYYSSAPGVAQVAQYSNLAQSQVASSHSQQYNLASSVVHGPSLLKAAPFPKVQVSYAAPQVAHAAPVAQVSYSGPVFQLPHSAKVAGAVKNVHTDFLENYDAHPRYAYEYGVNDPHTGDIKQAKEERDGEVVKGQYSLVEPDGSVRTVDYFADWETGFHANVRNSKQNQH